MSAGILQRLPWRRKLLLGLTLLGAANLVVVVLAFWSLSTLSRLIQERLGVAVRQARLAGQVAEHTLQCRRFEKDIFLNLGLAAELDRYQKEWLRAYQSLTQAVTEYQGLASSSEDQAEVARWVTQQQAYRSAMDLVMKGVGDNTIQTADQANQAITPFKDSIRTLTDATMQTAQRKMAEVAQAEADLDQIASFFKTLILAVAAVSLLGCLWWSYRLTQEVTRPIQELRQAAEQVAAGNWHTLVPVDGDDDLGQLAAAFNRMTAQLRDKPPPTVHRSSD